MGNVNTESSKERLVMGGVVVTLTTLIILFSDYLLVKYFFIGAVALLATLALKEYYNAVRHFGYDPLTILGLPTSALFCIAVYGATRSPYFYFAPAILLFFFFLSLFAHYMSKGSRPIENMALTTFGIIYITIPFSLLILVGAFGKFWLFYLLATTKSADMAAYFVGKNWGKKRLAPFLSPGKTVEGALAGIIIPTAISVLFGYAGRAWGVTPEFPIVVFVLLGIFLSFLGQIGDLAESLVKRNTGIKDSGRLPGLGGILDMIDSLLFTTPALYFFLKLAV